MLLVSMFDGFNSLMFFAVLIYIVVLLIFYIYSKVFSDDYDLSEFFKITSIIYAIILVVYFEVLVIVIAIMWILKLTEIDDGIFLTIAVVILYGGLSFAAIYWSLKDTIDFKNERIIITATYVVVTIVLLLINTQNMIFV